MPNHVTNVWTITGPEPAIRTILHDGFSFNNIVPEPEGIRDLDADSQYELNTQLANLLAGEPLDEKGLALAKKQADTTLFRFAAESGEPGRQTLQSLTDADAIKVFFCLHAANGVVADLLRGRQIYFEHGTSDWYAWSIENWGTKWDAYDRDVSEIEELPDGQAAACIRFNTAWSPPDPIVSKLRDMGVTVDGGWFDEGWCHCGHIVDGHAIPLHPNSDSQEVLALYEQIYGEPYVPDPADSAESL